MDIEKYFIDLKNIKWLNNIGQDIEPKTLIEIKTPLQQIKTSDSVNKISEKNSWINRLIEEDNDIFNKFKKIRKQEEWNPFAISFNRLFDLEFKNTIIESLKLSNLEEELYIYIRLICLYHSRLLEYKNINSDFVNSCFNLIKNGNLPCGWNQKEQKICFF